MSEAPEAKTAADVLRQIGWPKSKADNWLANVDEDVAAKLVELYQLPRAGTVIARLIDQVADDVDTEVFESE